MSRTDIVKSRLYMFADESGDFCGPRSLGQSAYFILTTVTVSDCAVGNGLLTLRRELAWQGHGTNSEFHASEDTQLVRDAVFDLLQPHRFRIDTTILEKEKLNPRLRERPERLYAFIWRAHIRRLFPALATSTRDLLIVSAAIGTHKMRRVFHEQVIDATRRVYPEAMCRTTHWAANSDPCLQIADYCGWAIQRKWERGDTRSSCLIQEKIVTEIVLSASPFYPTAG